MSIRVRLIAAPLAGLLAALLVSGCSSKNPDSLIGMNLDENAAMMDANEVSDANAAATTDSNGNATSSHASSAAQSNAGAAANAPAEEPSATANVSETDNPADDESTANQVENEGEPPSEM